MDLYMPFISGSDMVKMLRTKPELKNIPIVSYTSVSSDERKLWDPETFDDHLGKPVTRANLFRILTRFLRYEIRSGEKGKDKRQK
jgi:CheY-like chemotaxis protein